MATTADVAAEMIILSGSSSFSVAVEMAAVSALMETDVAVAANPLYL